MAREVFELLDLNVLSNVPEDRDLIAMNPKRLKLEVAPAFHQYVNCFPLQRRFNFQSE
jgi:hypothetical protein